METPSSCPSESNPVASGQQMTAGIRQCWGTLIPELQPWLSGSPEDYQTSVIASLSQLYGGSAREQLIAQKAAAQNNFRQRSNTRSIHRHRATNPSQNGTIQTQAFAECLPPPFVVRFSFQDQQPSSNTSIDVGTWMVLMPSDQDHLSSSSSNSSFEPQPYNGTLSLTTHLLDQITAGQLRSLDPDDVVPYLQDSLAWKVYSGSGALIGLPSLEALSVEVFSTEARIPQNPDMPVTYSANVTAHPEVTEGMGGGTEWGVEG